ncbi:antibiotic biosynthesis monooxygenase [Hymenobacter tibetensis]|uniref:Antibiotic biosynthesis monooxygenase n=1 Tax=Hymenobacter tibetensis TaxID=497967 RepID=A0ABY4CT85_9BACT|nr:putative quinol monooxygenase [Hymenobacter tibetensis]UOG73473.1 antibiotic biosynthesis monooxygenase [Hymenobacter tibetensis]
MNTYSSGLWQLFLSGLLRLIAQLRSGLSVVLLTGVALLVPRWSLAQASSPRTQVVTIVVNAGQLDYYKAALQEEIETSLRLEPGVLMLYAVASKQDPTRITLLEHYASEAAYQTHLQAPHVLKFRALVKDMITSRDLVPSTSLVPQVKATR